MTTFLLLLSLILNAAAIFAIILLYLRQNRLVEAEKKQERIIKEIEEVFSAYLLELKEENELFIKKFKKKSSPDNRIPDNDSPSEMKEVKSSEEKEKPDHQTRIAQGISYHAARKAYQQNIGQAPPQEDFVPEPIEEEVFLLPITESEDAREADFFEQVMALKNQGKSNEEIARILNKGKTEIELLLKFRQNT